MQVRLINGDGFEADSVEMQGEWVVARIAKGVNSPNSRAIPRSNIEQIIVGDQEEWGRVSWNGGDERNA